jgi:hypothetical protein
MIIFDKISYTEFQTLFPKKVKFALYDKIFNNFFRIIVYSMFAFFICFIFVLFLKLPSSYYYYSIAGSLILGLITNLFLSKRFKKLENEIPKGIVSTIYIKTNNAIVRQGADDYTDSLYLDISQDGKQKVFFMNGLYLVELLDLKELPNTEFKIYQDQNSLEILRVKTFGKYFSPQMTLPAFSESELTNFEMPSDATILDMTIDNIK